MKKLLALLLAFLLPAVALAETYELTLMMDVNQDYLKEALSSISESSGDAETLVDTLLSLMDNTGVAMKCQEDALAIELLVSGEVLADFMLYQAEDRVIITSSLLKEYALVSEAEALTDEAAENVALLDAVDWSSLAGTLGSTLLDWFDALEPTVETGSFIGDAYEGGTVCTTMILTDSDIAGLVKQLLTDDLRSILSAALTLCGVDGEAVLAEFDTLNDRVADEDRYAYVLRIVEDDQEAFVGASLTIFEELAQVATLSLGRNGKEWKLVYGMGLDVPGNSVNYWLDATYSNTTTGSHSYSGGSITDWSGDKESSYAYVIETTEPLSKANWYFNTSRSGELITFDAGISEELSLGSIGLSGSAVTSPPALDCTLSLYDTGVSFMEIDVDFGSCAPLPALDETFTQVSMNDPADAEAYADAINGLSAMLLVRLMKVLPVDERLP